MAIDKYLGAEFEAAVAMRDEAEAAAAAGPFVHVHGNGVRCVTDKKGHATPKDMSPVEIVVDASEGFVPLWDQGVKLRWKFAAGTLEKYRNPTAAAAAVERLLGEAILAWGSAVPIGFTKHVDATDFEIVMEAQDDCDPNGCVLASAFLPDSGQHHLRLFPIFFRQPIEEQVETMAHEIGHVFGLRHWFALVSEDAFPAQQFGSQSRFTIMNYGPDSRLTDTDRADLAALYQAAWSRRLTHINGTPIKLVRPFHELPAADGAFAIAAARG